MYRIFTGSRYERIKRKFYQEMINVSYNTITAKNTGTNTIAIVFKSLITVFSAGPAVSL